MLKSKRLIISVAVIAVLAAPVAWYLASPLFISQRVDEEFPLSAGALVPPDMTKAEVEKAMSDAAKTETRASGNMPSGATLLLSGQFKDADSFHKGEGTAGIYNVGGGKLALRLDQFKVTNGPDLHVILTKNADPKSRDDVQGGYEEVAKLKGNIGAQNYELRDGLKLEEYGAVVIYCKPFHVLFSVASLKKAG